MGQNSTLIHIIEAEDKLNFSDLAGVLLESDGDALKLAAQAFADRPGRPLSSQAAGRVRARPTIPCRELR